MKNVKYKLQPGEHYIDTEGRHLTCSKELFCDILEIKPGQIILRPLFTAERYIVLNEKFV
jgi:hypothetical protein